MTTFQQVRQKAKVERRQPPRLVELPVDAWAAGVTGAPNAPVTIGLRIPTDREEEEADASARQEALLVAQNGDDEDLIRTRNNVLIKEILGCAVCLPLDVTMPFFETPQRFQIERRLTSKGIARLWQELEVLRASGNAAMPEIDDAGASHLDAMLIRGVAWEFMQAEEARKIRRLLEHCRQELAQAEEIAEKRGVILAAG